MQGVEEKTATQVPKLQRTTTTTAGKFAVLRSALAASLPKEKADPMIQLVNDLEKGGVGDEDFKTHLEAAGLHMSKWNKVQGAVRTGWWSKASKLAKLDEADDAHKSESKRPELRRAASVAEEAKVKLTRAL